MAVLASKAPYSSSLGMAPSQPSIVSQYAASYRKPVGAGNSVGDNPHNGAFMSPTESEFSQGDDGQESIRSWDEKKVGEWLRNINCAQYEQLFKGMTTSSLATHNIVEQLGRVASVLTQNAYISTVNNVTGSNLIECDQIVLKEMGIKKIGDRVRIFVAIKALRTKAVGNSKKRNRDSIAHMDKNILTPYTPNSSNSPRNPLGSAGVRERTNAMNGRRTSTVVDGKIMQEHHGANGDGRPGSPYLEDQRIRGMRSAEGAGRMSPMTSAKKEGQPGYFANQSTSSKTVGARPGTPSGSAPRSNPVMDSTVGKLPAGSPVIRVIYNGGQTKVLDIKNCRILEDVVLIVLRKLNLPTDMSRNYCFWTLDGTGQDLSQSHRLTDVELMRYCSEPFDRNERGRLILRKRHAGEPDEEELRKASSIALEEQNEIHYNAVVANNNRSKSKLTKLTGENWDDVSYPLSPATYLDGTRGNRARTDSGRSQLSQGWGDTPPQRKSSAAKPKIKEFLGGRPPSELISQELTTYFPDHKKETIENTVRQSMRRSARLSRAASRISVVSNASFASNLKDAPPLPNIADAWLNSAPGARIARPLSVSRFNMPQNAYRDSIASSSLQPLAEESSIESNEPNRKSYVSFESDSQAGHDNGNVSDSSHTALNSYFDESESSGPTTEAGGSLNDQLTSAIQTDGEEPDEELNQFLKGDQWENVKWMQGALIGQGSFGSVFLALHALTGELMAVKQVEVPSATSSVIDKRKESMVAALKREINLLRDLQHENIVQYLGSNSDDQHFNIFLEYVPGGSVAAMLASFGSLHEPLIRNFVRQILAGLSYLHGQDIIHRDIKGANVLVDNKGVVKISDFGISKRVEASAILQPQKHGGHMHRPSLQGSVFWMAPEVVKQTSYTRKADIWSLGCLIVEMFTGTHPFPNFNQLQAIFQIGNSSAKPNTPENASEDGKAFLAKTFEYDHEKRPSVDELLLSPFLRPTA